MSNPSFGLTPSQLNYTEPAQWRQAIRSALADTRCASPGFLVEDMAADQTVTVQIAIQERVRPTAGPAQWWDVAPIIKVPIIIPRGGGYSLTLPLKKGDEGLLIFCDTCFDLWWQNGQGGSPPAHTAKNTTAVSGSQRQFEVRRHYVHDCGFIPGMYSQPNKLTAYSSTSMQLRSDDGLTVIDVSELGVTVTGATVTLETAPGGTGISISSTGVSAVGGGTALPLMTQDWQTWFTTYVLPHISTGIIPPEPPTTTVLKGQ